MTTTSDTSSTVVAQENRGIYASGVLGAPTVYPLRSRIVEREGKTIWVQLDSLTGESFFQITDEHGGDWRIPESIGNLFPDWKRLGRSQESSFYSLQDDIEELRNKAFRRLHIDLFSECLSRDAEYRFEIFHEDAITDSRIYGTPTIFWEKDAEGTWRWCLSVVGISDEVILDSALYDDRDGIARLISRLEEPQELLVDLALNYPDEAKLLVNKRTARGLYESKAFNPISQELVLEAMLKAKLQSQPHDPVKGSGVGVISTFNLHVDDLIIPIALKIRPPERPILGRFDPDPTLLREAYELIENGEYAQAQEKLIESVGESTDNQEALEAGIAKWHQRFNGLIEASHNLIIVSRPSETNKKEDRYWITTLSEKQWDALSLVIEDCRDFEDTDPAYF